MQQRVDEVRLCRVGRAEILRERLALQSPCVTIPIARVVLLELAGQRVHNGSCYGLDYLAIDASHKHKRDENQAQERGHLKLNHHE